MNTKFFTVRKSTAFALVLSVLFSLLLPFSSLTVSASPAELLTEEELLRLSFQVLEGGAVDSSFTGFEVIEGGLSVASKEAMVSSFGSQILASAKALGYNIAVAGGVAVTEYVALEVGYHALDAIMDSSAGDEITKLWLNTFSKYAYNDNTSLATEKIVLKSAMLGELEDLLNIHYNGDFELNAGLVGNGVALGSDYFQNASATSVEAYEALNTTYQATFVFNGNPSTQYMTHYFVNGASYGIIDNNVLTLYTASGEACSNDNSNGRCTTSFILGTDFYGLTVYSNMTEFAINLGSTYQMISGAGIRLYDGSIDTPITSPVASPISQPDTAITLPSSITIPLDTDSALAIANGEAEAEVSYDNDSSTDTATDTSGFWAKLWDFLSKIIQAILSVPSEFLNVMKEALTWLFVPSDVFWEEWVNTEMEYINSQTGVLTYPLVLVLNFLDKIINIDAGDMVLTIPDVSWMGEKIFTETSFNMTQFLNDNTTLKNFMGYYYIVIKAILIIAVVNLARKKFSEMEMN